MPMNIDAASVLYLVRPDMGIAWQSHQYSEGIPFYHYSMATSASERW